VEKSRYVKEKSKIPVTVTGKGGISRWSGLLDMALECGIVVKPSNGWYAKVDTETGEVGEKWRIKDTNSKDFWEDILSNPKFKEFIETRYRVASGNIFHDEEDVDNE
jgi:hypothetical protein